MKRFLFTLVFAIGAGVPAFGDDVPFAQPPLAVPGQPGTPLASLGDIMEMIQLRHIKLWYAIKSKNWGLLNYELEQIKDSFTHALIYYRNIPVEYIVAVNKPLIFLQDAVKSKDGSKLEKGFADLTTACNSCHQAAEVGFIVIQKPNSSPFSDQNFLPVLK
jgi:hypothetical protein